MSDNKEKLTPSFDETAAPVFDETVPAVEELPADNKGKKQKPPKEKKTTGKESFSRTRAIIGVCLIVAAILVAVLLVPVLSGSDVTYNVLYAKQDVPAGVEITGENINDYFGVYVTTDKNLYTAGIPADTARDIIGGTFTKREIYAGKYPSVADFSKTNLVYTDRVPAGYELIAIDIRSMESTIGFMPKAGDIIKFYRMVEYEYTDEELYFDAANIHVPINKVHGSYAEVYEYLQYVEIFAAIDGDLQDADRGTAEVVYVVKVRSGVQALQLVEAAQSGNYYWSLVSSGDKGKAEALLKLQDQVIEQGVAGVGREEHLFALEDLTAGKLVPAINSTVRFAAATSKGAATALEYPAMLKYVTVLNIYDQNQVNMALDVPEVEGQEPEKRVPTYVGLNLTAEQAELLQKLIDEGQVFIKTVNETQDKIVSGFDAVNDLLWNDRAQSILQNAGKPEVEEDKETEGTPEGTPDESPEETPTEPTQPEATDPTQGTEPAATEPSTEPTQNAE